MKNLYSDMSYVICMSANSQVQLVQARNCIPLLLTTLQCAIILCVKANDLMLADFNFAVGWPLHQIWLCEACIRDRHIGASERFIFTSVCSNY